MAMCSAGVCTSRLWTASLMSMSQTWLGLSEGGGVWEKW